MEHLLCHPLIRNIEMDKQSLPLSSEGQFKNALGSDAGDKGYGNGVELHAYLQRESVWKGGRGIVSGRVRMKGGH